jgi:hypothetical protein
MSAPLRGERGRFLEALAVLFFQPVKDQPQVALQNRSFERVFDQLLPLLLI